MRILLLTSHLAVGGIPIYTVMLAKELARRGHQVTVVSGGGAMAAPLAEAGIPHVTVPLRITSELHPRVAWAVGRLIGLVRQTRPEVLHAQTRVTQVAAGLAGRLTGVPVVTTAHGFYRWRWGRRWLPFWGRHVIAVSPTTRRKLVLGYRVPRSKVSMIFNGIAWDPLPPAAYQAAAAQFRQAWGVTSAGPVIGTVARLGEAKGIPVLLEAFHLVRRRAPSAQLLIVGDGQWRDALVRQAYAWGEQDHVVFTGALSSPEVPLRLMDLYVQPSYLEAFGLAAVEAMAAARPVVASAVGGLRWIVRHGETGLLVPPRRAPALAAALLQLLEDPARAQAMGQAGRRRYQAQFTIERMAAEVEQVYARVLSERPR